MTIGAGLHSREVDYFSLHSRKQRAISVEMLDYAHVDKCEDVDELKGILALLRSGKEGRYPDLERATEDRILALLPARERRKIECMRAEPTPREVSTVKEDLASWAAEMDAKSRALQQQRAATRASVPPVRGHAPRSESTSAPTGMKVVATTRASDNQREKTRAIPAYDFRSWEKYDADKALAEIDEGDQRTREQAEQQHRERERRAEERKKELASLPEWVEVDALSPQVREVYALQEKHKGNECVKAGETDEAVLHYTRSIAFVDSDAVLYANRALAHLRLKSFALAEQDCSRAVLLDPGYLKAWTRRGMVRFRRGKYAEAVEDFEQALRLDPGNKEVDKLLIKTRAKWEQVDGTVADNQAAHEKENEASVKPFTRFEVIEEEEGEKETKRGPSGDPPVGFTRFEVVEEDEDKAETFTRFEIIEDDDEDDDE